MRIISIVVHDIVLTVCTCSRTCTAWGPHLIINIINLTSRLILATCTTVAKLLIYIDIERVYAPGFPIVFNLNLLAVASCECRGDAINLSASIPTSFR